MYLNGTVPTTGAQVMRAELIGSTTATARAVGITTCGATPVFELCRNLVAAGIDPRTALIVYRGGTLALRVRSIGEGAALTVETDRDGRPSFRRRRDKRAASYGAASPVRQNQTADIGAANQQAQP